MLSTSICNIWAEKPGAFGVFAADEFGGRREFGFESWDSGRVGVGEIAVVAGVTRGAGKPDETATGVEN